MKPEISKTIKEIRTALHKISQPIGFVPTMGYLHQGHLSLVETAKKECKTVVVSIYVNPSQFAPNEDLEDYPRDLEKDISLLTELKVDHIFFPADAEMYPDEFKTWVTVEKLTNKLCGKSRPHHFRGVTTIVSKLMNIVSPDKMYMGEKDFQQLVVLRQMAKDLNFPVEVIGCPIVREPDGLAMSSRNKYLNKKDRINALSIHKSLLLAKGKLEEGEIDSAKIIASLTSLIVNHQGTIDYVDIIDSNTLQHIRKLEKGCRILIAAYFGNTRLIDNMEI